MAEYECPECEGGFPYPAKDRSGFYCPWCRERLVAGTNNLTRGKRDS